MSLSPATCHILGLGAIGGLCARTLHAGGWHCRALVRDSARRGNLDMVFTDMDGSEHDCPIAIDQGDQPIDYLLITTKAHQTAAALQPLLPRLHDSSSILVLQNGLQGFADTQDMLPNQHILAATTTEGVNRPTPAHWIHAGRGVTWLGPLMGDPQQLETHARTWLTSLKQGGLDAVYDPDIRQRLWRKLLINSAINPLTVVFDCRNGDLLTNPEAHTLLVSLSREANAIMAAQPGLSPLPDPVSDVEDVARQTARNLSSMLQDARNGRDTEIDAINGYLVTMALPAGLPCATHQWVIDQVRQRPNAGGSG